MSPASRLPSPRQQRGVHRVGKTTFMEVTRSSVSGANIEATNLQSPPPLSFYIPPTAQTRVPAPQITSSVEFFSYNYLVFSSSSPDNLTVKGFSGPALPVKVPGLRQNGRHVLVNALPETAPLRKRRRRRISDKRMNGQIK